MSEQIAVKIHFGVETSKPEYLPSVEIKLNENIVVQKQEIRHDDKLSFNLYYF